MGCGGSTDQAHVVEEKKEDPNSLQPTLGTISCTSVKRSVATEGSATSAAPSPDGSFTNTSNSIAGEEPSLSIPPPRRRRSSKTKKVTSEAHAVPEVLFFPFVPLQVPNYEEEMNRLRTMSAPTDAAGAA